MRVQVKNSERGGPPKYKLSEIAQMLGVTLGQMQSLIAKNGGFPSPCLGFGFKERSPDGKRDYCQRSYYNKKEVIDWYKKVTADK